MATMLKFIMQKHQALITKTHNAMQAESFDLAQAKFYLDELSKADEYNYSKFESLLGEEPINADEIIQVSVQLNEELLDTKASLSAIIHEQESQRANERARSQTPPPQKSNEVKVKLPEISLPTFNGKLDQWQSFWDQFKALVHDCADLPEVTKLSYLKAQLKDHPADLVAGFPITHSSYAKVVQLLETTYANPDVVSDQLLRNLLTLKKPAYKADELMKFRADTEYLLSGLSNLGRDIDAADWIFAFCIKDKLPMQALEYIQAKVNTDHPTLAQVRTHLLSVINHVNAQNHSNPSQQTSQQPPHKESNPKFNPNSSNFSAKTKSDRYSASVARGSIQQKVSSPQCIFCGNDKHRSYLCTKFLSRSARQEQLRKAGKCTKCCRKHDFQTNCNLQECLSCKKGKHHSYLCDESIAKLKSTQTANTSAATSYSASAKTTNPTTNTTAAAVNTSGKETSVLPVAQVGLLNRKTRRSTFHKALLDTGSQRTFMYQSLADHLGLKPSSTVQLQVEGFTGQQETHTYPVVKFTVKIGRSYLRCRALVTQQMPRTVTMHGLTGATQHLKNKVNLNLKNPTSDTITDIDLLIGMDFYFKLVSGQTRIDGVNLIKTPGGYVIAGQLPNKYIPVNIQQNVALVARINLSPDPEQETLAEINERVTSMWSLEQLGVKPTENLTPEETWVEEQFQNSVTYEDGQYWVCLPWKPEHPELLSNKAQTYYRTKTMYNKLISDPVQLDHYHKVFDKQLEQEFVELTSSAEDEGHYLPHLCVKKSSSTTPLRIVYDCSAKGPNKVSLNDCLYKGPSLVEKLHSVLVGFRTEPYATTADISKAFLRVGLQEKDRPYTKFFGPSQLQQFDPPQTYQFKSVLFGSTSSPYLLQAVLRHHLGIVHGDDIDAQSILNSMYVDNLQYTSTTEVEAVRVCNSAQKLLPAAGMPLQEWHSNSSQVQSHVQLNSQEAQTDTISVLGIEWNITTDTLSVKPVKFTTVQTKRQLLSNCSRIYDPLGLISPITLSHKLLIQKVWTLKVTWDEELPESVCKLWEECLQNTRGFETFKFPRAVATKTQYHELHIFVDASPKAYGACVYLSCPGQTPKLLQSKSRVSPIEERTLPQLELTAILLGVRLMNNVKTILKDQPLASTTIWSDSQIALSWVLNNQSNCVYVRNRVRDIRKEFPLLNFQYVNTEDNPADFLTKPRNITQLSRTNIWFQGPEWLSDHLVIQTNVAITHNRSTTPPEPILDYTKYNNLVSLLSVTRLVFSAISKMRKQTKLPSPWMYWSNFIQRKHFPAEHCHMAENKPFTSRITRPALVRDLRLGYSKAQQVLVVEGRLQNSEVRPQILLPKDDHFTTLVVKFYHDSNHHCGTNQTLSHVRRTFWILQGRQKVRSVLKNCYVCKRLTVSSYQVPPVPPLPEERVTNAIPFQVTGIDYFGPITLQKESKTLKVYGVLFTCASVRAIHLELASDLSAETFINSFRNFIARRSCPKVVITDNATNFISGSQIINAILSQAEPQQFFLDREIEWRNIPPRAPWMGGFYERLVGVVKGSLRKALFRKRVTEQELRTLLTEIEAQVNNRPLTYQTNDPQDLQALTPNHILLGKPIETFPICQYEEDFVPYNEHLTYNSTYRRHCKIMTHWRTIWSTDYLNSLKERKLKRNETKPASPIVAVGDICLLADSGKRREKWSLCKVLEVLPDGEGHVRVARVRVGNSEMIRAIKHLYPLESAPEDQDLNDSAGHAGLGLRTCNPPQEVDLSTEREGTSSPNKLLRTTSDSDAGAATLVSMREPQGSIDDCSQEQSPQPLVNNVPLGSPSLGIHRRKPRQAAQKCKAWLKEVAAKLSEDDV